MPPSSQLAASQEQWYSWDDTLQIGEDEQAPELSARLFKLGSSLLLQHLPQLLSGDGQQAATPQDESRASHAAKVGCLLVLPHLDARLFGFRPTSQDGLPPRAMMGNLLH